MRAGIIITGTEVLSGIIRDANGPWLSEALRARGVVVSHIVIVGDRPDDLRSALDFLSDHDLVVTSGGLGPTADDLTADVVAEWAGAAMEHDPALEERIWAVVSRLRRRMPGFEDEPMRAGARKQAHVPAGAAVLEPVGTAPGLLVSARGPLVAVLPGPPRELQTMWEAAVATSPLRELLESAGELEQRILRFFPLPEPQIAATLREIGDVPFEVTTCLRRGELEVATVFSPDQLEVYDAFEAELRARHGDVLSSGDRATIDVVIARLLEGSTIATAESCTGGLMAGRLTDLAGSAGAPLRGLVG